MLPDKKEKLLKYIQDALYAANELQNSLSFKTFQDYHISGNRWIAERGIEIISEALKRAIQIEEHLLITDLKKLFATRNKIAHEYDFVDPYLLYYIVQNHIPVLITELNTCIKTLETT